MTYTIVSMTEDGNYQVTRTWSASAADALEDCWPNEATQHLSQVIAVFEGHPENLRDEAVQDIREMYDAGPVIEENTVQR